MTKKLSAQLRNLSEGREVTSLVDARWGDPALIRLAEKVEGHEKAILDLAGANDSLGMDLGEIREYVVSLEVAIDTLARMGDIRHKQVCLSVRNSQLAKRNAVLQTAVDAVVAKARRNKKLWGLSRVVHMPSVIKHRLYPLATSGTLPRPSETSSETSPSETLPRPEVCEDDRIDRLRQRNEELETAVNAVVTKARVWGNYRLLRDVEIHLYPLATEEGDDASTEA